MSFNILTGAKTDYSKINEFNKHGHHYTKILATDKYIVWEIEVEYSPNYHCEVWKKVPFKNPDGSVIEAKSISDEEFGRNGWYFVGKNKSQVRDRIWAYLQIAI